MSTAHAVTRYRTGSNSNQSHRNHRRNSNSSSSHRLHQHHRQPATMERNRVLPPNRNASQPWHAPHIATTPPGPRDPYPWPTTFPRSQRRNQRGRENTAPPRGSFMWLPQIDPTPRAVEPASLPRTQGALQSEESASAVRCSTVRTHARNPCSYRRQPRSLDRPSGDACAARHHRQSRFGRSSRSLGSAHSERSLRHTHPM